MDFDDMPDGNLIACGVGGFEVYGKWDAYPLVSKLSPTGAFIWERWLPTDIAYVVGDIKATPDGGCIVIGTQERPRPGGGYEYYAALVKLDSQGCLQPNCDSLLVISPTAEAPAPAPPALRVQPNPASDGVSVFPAELGGRITVTDLLGRSLRSQRVTEPVLQIQTADLQIGRAHV